MVITTIMETSINKLLVYDEESLSLLSSHTGKVLAVDLINTDSVFFITITHYGLKITTEHEGEPEVFVYGTPLELINYLIAIDGEGSISSGSFIITGDIALAQKLQSIFRNLDVDWEEHISHWIGDNLAHKSGRTVNKTINLIRNVDSTIKSNISEYLRYEKEVLINKNELSEFNDSVDKLRDDVERLKAKINRISETIGDGLT